MEEKPEFLVIPAKEASFRKKRMITTAKENIDVIVSKKRLLSVLVSYGEEALSALNKGVKYRMIVEGRDDDNLFPRIWKSLKRNSKFELRYISFPPRVLMSIYDSKEALFSVSAATPQEDKCLWTSNESLLALAKDYFEIIWVTRMDTPFCLQEAIRRINLEES